MPVRNRWMRIPIIVGVLMTSLFATSAPQPDPAYVILTMDDIVVPIALTPPKPDLTPPTKARFKIAPPTTTYDDKVTIEIVGETDSRIYLNGQMVGTVDNSGSAVITLDTSGTNTTKHFSIVLADPSGNRSEALHFSIEKAEDPKYSYSYKGLPIYRHDKESSAYRLDQLTDTEFNALPRAQKLQVADNLLSTLFFGYPLQQLEAHIQSGTFISDLQEAIKNDTTDKGQLEEYILDDRYFYQYTRWGDPQIIAILTRFYAMDHLDRYYFNNWMAYILTQTILFSPADELDSTHGPDITNIYRRLVNFFSINTGMRYTTYIHMMSQENWRRFRSPEDNGREMLEIFMDDENDDHVPIAGQALQNWKLNEDADTLEIGMNENRSPLHMFGTIIHNGDDFYREMVKTDQFVKTVTTRLVKFFFPKATLSKQTQIVNDIAASHPETFKDILAQIIFSKAYLLHNERPKSAEEVFFSLAKRIGYLHRRSTFYSFKEALIEMHQASMHYKLGKLNRVPLDSLSFAYYHRYIRQNMLIYRSNPDKFDNYDSWSRQGWNVNLVGFDRFSYDESDLQGSLKNFIDYLFETTIARKTTASEIAMFKNHMLTTEDGELRFVWEFDMFATRNDPEDQAKRREQNKINIATLVLDYISRLQELYVQKEVQ